MNRKWIRLRAIVLGWSPEDVLAFDRETEDDAREVWAQDIRAEATACNNCGALGAHEIEGRMVRICEECMAEYTEVERKLDADMMVGGEES